MHTASRVTLAALALIALAATSAQSQTNNASIQATASVQTPINVVGDANLVFGNVFPGLAKTIAVTDAGAGHFSATGQATANVDLTFSLPGTLSDGSGNTMPIGTWTGHHNNANLATGGTDFTPSGTPTSTQLSGSGQKYVFIGATVSPATNQAAGSYSGQVSMTVVYF